MKPVSRSPPLWLGCDAFAWLELLFRHRFAVDRSRRRLAGIVSLISPFHTILRLGHQILCRHMVSSTAIRHAPVFILGHWRSGTTLLHELLASDPRHAAPTTYDCFCPHHFLLSRAWLPRLCTRLMPRQRPMDNMPAGWDRPQEDEFALCLLGLPSLYRRLAFPDDPFTWPRRESRHWRTSFRRLLQELTLAHGDRRLILKSPPHAFRVPTFLELFPDARFVHLVRDPYDLYPSTLHLWRVLFSLHGLQRPAWEALPEFILDTFVRMDACIESASLVLASDRFSQMRYENLILDPVGQLEGVYQTLDLGEFEPARAHVVKHLAGLQGHEANRYVLTPAERATISERWGAVIRRHGYPLRPD